MFNRRGARLSISAEFKPALDQMRAVLDCEAFKWADCEALERRHNIGRGTLIVLDVIPEPEYAATPLHERRRWLEIVLDELDLDARPPENTLRLPTRLNVSHAAWGRLQNLNRQMGCEFYEGLVAKRADSKYPIQLRSPDQEFPWWMKHRWTF